MSQAGVEESRCPRWQQPQPPGKLHRGALPRTFTSHFSGIPLTTASPRRGWFFRLSVSCVQLFYLGAVLTRPRLADARMQPLHDSVVRDRGRDPAGAHSIFHAAASATSAVQGRACSPGCLRVAQEGLCPSEVGSTRTRKKARVPNSYCSGGDGR